MFMRRILPAMLAAVAVLFAGAARAELKKDWVEYTQGSKKLKAYTVYDDAKSGKRPAVLLIHAREGMTPRTRELTELWARLGYVAFAADIFGYGEGVLPKTTDEMAAQTGVFRKDPALGRARTQAGYDTLAKLPMVDAARIASIGYCFGGDISTEFSTTGVPLLLNVTIHGSFGKYEPGWAKTVKGRFLILHGAEDSGYPLAVVNGVIDELRTAKVPFQAEIYGGATHGFSTPRGADNERANNQSIAATTRALSDVFGL